MKTIWKYKINNLYDSIEVPKEAKLLDINFQEGNVAMWFLVDTKNEKECRFFQIYGTGSEIDEDMSIEKKYIKTVVNKPYVWHVFEIKY